MRRRRKETSTMAYLTNQFQPQHQKYQKYKAPNIIHSDRGAEYLSEKHLNLCKVYGVSASASGSGQPWQNGFMERFFNTFKEEQVGEKDANGKRLRMDERYSSFLVDATALSRKDNKIETCPECGVREAIEAYCRANK